MPLLVRKISPAKWWQRNIFEGEPPSADAITSDLKTIDNNLSIWEVNSREELDDVILAITSAGDHLDRIDIVVIQSEHLEVEDLEIVKSEGFTPYSDFRHKHRDITKLDYDSLGKVAQVIIESMRSVKPERITLSKLIDILNRGITEEKIRYEELKEGIRRHLSPDR